jgi:hypothetical protein
MRLKTLIELGRTTCRAGQIRRRGYTTKRGVRVRPACVPDTGKRGKTPPSGRILPTPRPGALKGWRKDMAPEERRRIIRSLVREAGCGDVIKRLTLLGNITADAGTQRAVEADKNWLRDQGFCVLKSGKRSAKKHK